MSVHKASLVTAQETELRCFSRDKARACGKQRCLERSDSHCSGDGSCKSLPGLERDCSLPRAGGGMRWSPKSLPTKLFYDPVPQGKILTELFSPVSALCLSSEWILAKHH